MDDTARSPFEEDSVPAPLGAERVAEEQETAVRRGPPGQRASKSADEARARMLARIRAMTPRERMIRALSLAEETDELLAQLGRARR